MLQVRQDGINFRFKAGMSGVGKIFSHQPVCQVPCPPSRYVCNLFFIWYSTNCTKTMSPAICHWTATAEESTRGGTVSFTVIIMMDPLPNWILVSFHLYLHSVSRSCTGLWSLFTDIYAGIEEGRWNAGSGRTQVTKAARSFLNQHLLLSFLGTYILFFCIFWWSSKENR